MPRTLDESNLVANYRILMHILLFDNGKIFYNIIKSKNNVSCYC